MQSNPADVSSAVLASLHAERTLGSRKFLAAIVGAVLGELAQPDVRECIAARIAEQLEERDLGVLMEQLLRQ
jgi:hypothetical protein